MPGGRAERDGAVQGDGHSERDPDERDRGERDLDERGQARRGGETELRRSPTMAHLLDALQAGTDIGHYGHLTFAMVARHFLDGDEIVRLLADQPGMDETKARALLLQVEERDYNPPRRERLLEWQAHQEFPLLPDPDDPECGNLYRELEFPERIYDHINDYWTETARSEEAAGEER